MAKEFIKKSTNRKIRQIQELVTQKIRVTACNETNLKIFNKEKEGIL